MLVDHFMMHRAHEREPVEHLRTATEMLADLHAGDGGVDGWIVGACFFRFGITELLGIPGVNLPGTPAEPEEYAVLGFAAHGRRGFRRATRNGCQGSNAGGRNRDKIASMKQTVHGNINS